MNITVAGIGYVGFSNVLLLSQNHSVIALDVSHEKIEILIPIYNDWRSVFELLKNIDQQINDLNDEVSVLIVNDGSNEEKEEENFEFKNIKSIKIINMKENKGHARCNAVGLKYIFEKDPKSSING